MALRQIAIMVATKENEYVSRYAHLIPGETFEFQTNERVINNLVHGVLDMVWIRVQGSNDVKIQARWNSTTGNVLSLTVTKTDWLAPGFVYGFYVTSEGTPITAAAQSAIVCEEI